MKHGFALIDKPLGMTSHDAVAIVRRELHERDIGHLGTLDPAATGLLVLAVGKKALKVVELFSGLSKEYEAEIRLGEESTTYDSEGVITGADIPKGWFVPEEAIVRRLIADRFLGRIKQVPPIYSAVHVGGERAYRKARQGRGVNMPERDVEISACDVLSFVYPQLTLRVACGSGTYIRSLAHDLGKLLRCGGYLSALRRTKVGPWSVEQATGLDAITWMNVTALKDVLVSLPQQELTVEEFDHLKFGRDIEGTVTKNTIGWFDGLPVAVLEPKEGKIHARKVL